MKTIKMPMRVDVHGSYCIVNGRWVPRSDWRKLMAVVKAARKIDDPRFPYIVLEAIRKLDGKKGK